jgi:hypothetical protein
VVSWPPLCNETIGLHSPKRIQSSWLFIKSCKMSL